MRQDIVKVRFRCEGTTFSKDGVIYCCAEEVLEGTPDEIHQKYYDMGWGYIDPYGIRNLCNRMHLESMGDYRA